MTQYARPDSDLYVAQYTYSGQRWAWWASTYTDDLYTKIDEATADDSDYAWYKSDGSDAGQDWYRASLSEIDEPSDLSTVSIRVRVQNSVNCTVRLYDGTTLIKSFSTGTNGSVTNIDTALTSTEAGNISDWSDLELRFGCYDQTAYQTCYIYQAYLEAGDAPATGETVTPDAAVAVATGTDPTVTEGESGETVTPAEAIAVATGTAPTVTSGGTVTPAVSAAIATGTSPTVSSGSTITPSVAASTATVTSPTITSGLTLSSIVAAAVATAQDPTVESATDFAPSPASIVATATILPITPYGILYITDPMIRIPSVSSASIKTPSATSKIVSSKEE